MNLPRLSVQNPVAVNLLMWLILLVGGWHASTIVRELFPNVQPEQIRISVLYPGASPAEIEKAIVRPLERELDDVDLVEDVESRIFEGLAQVVLTLEDGADRNAVLNDARGEVDQVTPELPAGAEDPEIELLRPYFPVIAVVVHGDVPEARLATEARRIRDDLLRLPQISQIVVTGLRDPEIHVLVRPEKLEEHGVTFEEIGRTLASLNLDAPGGRLESATGTVGVRTMGESDRALVLEDHAIVVRDDGSVLRLRDLGETSETFEDKVEIGRFAGRRAVQMTVFKTPEQDALAIAATIKEWVAANSPRLGGAIEIDTSTDLSRFISQRLDLMLRNARVGLLLVLIALALFLDLRVAFWVALGLPVSLLGSFIILDWLGGTINLISLLAFIVVLGLIVDDAIVIGENVFARLREGMSPRDAAIAGTNEVGIPVLAAILTTVAAFLPLGFLDGQVGQFMKELPLVVIAALAVSLIEAFIILPGHLGHLRVDTGPRGPLGRAAARLATWRAGWFEERLPKAYGRLLTVALRWRYVTLALAVATALAAAGLVVGGIVPFVLLQESDAESVVVDLEMAAGTPEERTIEVVDRLEKVILGQSAVAKAVSMVGISFGDRGVQPAADPATVGQITVELLSAEEREAAGLPSSQDLLATLRRETEAIRGVKTLTFTAQSGGPQGSDIELQVRGDDLDRLREAVLFIEDELRGYDGVVDIQDDLTLGKLEVRLELRDEARLLGLTTRDLAEQVRHALFGFEVQELQGPDEEIAVRVLLPKSDRDGIEDLADLRIVTPDGARVPLEEAALLRTERGFATISRVNGKRTLTVKAEVDEAVANIQEITADLEARVADIGGRFPGVAITFEGRKKETADSFRSLKVGFPIALFLIYAIIAILFRSYIQPVLVMAAIPFAFIGVIAGHFVMGFPFTIMSMIGGVALSGIVVNDSLILVDFVNRKRREGESLFDAVVHGGKARLRAIVLTSITTVVGLAPLLLEKSFQAQFLIPMAISIVYGLAVATLVTLIVLPCLYLVFEDARRAVRAAWGES